METAREHRTNPGAPGRPSRSARGRTLAGVLLAGVVLLAPPPAAASHAEQEIVLQPGWNAVYLEVRPEPDDIEAALAGLPVASVWTYQPDDDPVQFIRDPEQGLLSVSGWWGYFPYPRPEAFLSNLFILQANRAYLIKLDGSVPVTWRVRGTPVLRRQTWVADSFNLVGLPVDPSRPPTFGAYFAPSSAHDGQPVFRLAPDGTWQRVQQPYSETVRSGEAYWVYCAGGSAYQGPLEVRADVGEGLEYSAALSEQNLVLRNHNLVDVDVTVRLRSSAAPVPMVLEVVDDTTSAVSWPALPTSYTVNVPAEEEVILNLGVRRSAFSADRVEQVMEVSNGLGVRRLVAVGATAVQAAPEAKASAAFARTTTEELAGLWVGEVLVDAVSAAQTGGTTPLPVGRPFALRLIVHVDGGGAARLVKQAIQMWEEGTFAPSATDPTYLTVDTPGRYVLLTDETLIPNYTGATLRDGQPVGIRVSTVDYDFEGDELDLAGDFSTSGTLTGTIVLPSEHPTNPYLHFYHPDHDNLDAQFLNPRAEAYAVTRDLQLSFSPTDPRGLTPPGWGDSTLGGTYVETITGIHRYPIYVSGSFRLHRVSAVAVLNQ